MITKKYKKNYLEEVIVRADFASPIFKLKNSLTRPIEKKIISYFPVTDIVNTIKINENIKLNEWNFYGGNREKYLKISQNCLIIDYNKYSSFEILKNEFLDLINQLINLEPELQLKRFGLRYKNVIKFNGKNPTNWDKFFNKNLISIFKIPKYKNEITRAFSNLSLKSGDVMLTFQYGMHNPDFPLTIKKKIFILDLDAYTDKLIKGDKDIEYFLENFHSIIHDMFENSLDEKLRMDLNND